MRARQPYLSAAFKPRTEFGGKLNQGKRKQHRPIDPKRAIHLVLKAEKARGKLSMLQPAHKGRIFSLVEKWGNRFGVRVYRQANVGNHLHLLVKAKTRAGFKAFLRTVTGKVAQLVTGATKGHAFGRFWTELAFTRILEWGRAYRIIQGYLDLNVLEGEGLPWPSAPS